MGDRQKKVAAALEEKDYLDQCHRCNGRKHRPTGDQVIPIQTTLDQLQDWTANLTSLVQDFLPCGTCRGTGIEINEEDFAKQTEIKVAVDRTIGPYQPMMRTCVCRKPGCKWCRGKTPIKSFKTHPDNTVKFPEAPVYRLEPYRLRINNNDVDADGPSQSRHDSPEPSHDSPTDVTKPKKNRGLAAAKKQAQDRKNAGVPQWECNLCTVLNDPTEQSCTTCLATRGITRNGDWTCKQCTWVNGPLDQKCVKCMNVQ